MITAAQLKEISPRLTDTESTFWAGEFNKAMPVYNIDTPARIQQFIATVMHESWGLRVFVENLNYSAEALINTFKKYRNDPDLAQRHARKPELIANTVYANRMGNGPESSGDGWRYRGRCPIQATGKDMYRAIGKACFSDSEILVKNPDLLLRPEYGAPAACWIWKSKGCNEMADHGNFEGATKLINGGLNGLEDRYRWLAVCEKIINQTPSNG